MKKIMHKGDDFLSADETLYSILLEMGLIEDIEDKYGNRQSKIKDDCVIDVRRIRRQRNNREVEEYEQ